MTVCLLVGVLVAGATSYSIIAAARPADAAGGDFDPSFSSDGVQEIRAPAHVFHRQPVQTSNLLDVAVAPDGTVVGVGRT